MAKPGAVGCAVVAAVLTAGVARAQAPRYRVRIVEGLAECAAARPVAIDERGQVTGERCLWNPSGLLAPPPGHPDLFANDIAGGVVTGEAIDADALHQAVVWRDGQPQVLPLAPGFGQALGLFINGRGDVLGQVDSETQGSQIALWPGGGAPSVITLGPGAGNRDLHGFNDRRQLVGCASFRGQFGGHIVPFLWSEGQTRILEPSSWNRPEGCALAINDAGTVAGESDQRPVFWQNGALVRLAPAGLQGFALDVNNRGALVGTLNGRDFFSDGSAVWDLFGLVDDPALLPSLGRLLAINDQGQILATHPTPDAPFSGVALLEPQAPPSGPDPVPPVVRMTSPWNGEPLVDLVTLEADASDNVAVAGVQFFANGRLVGAEDTSPPYAVEADVIDLSMVPFFARARDTAGNFTSTPVRFAAVQRDCHFAPAGQSVTGSLGAQTGSFTAHFTGFASALTEAGFALASGTPGGFAATSAAVLFASDGEIKVRNGAAYAGTGVRYRIGVYHHFRLVVDVPGNRYSVYLKFANEPEALLAADSAFRGARVIQLDHWMVRADEASPNGAAFDACNIRLP